MLAWWQQYVQYKKYRRELLESSCCHMEAYTVHRCAGCALTITLQASCIGTLPDCMCELN
jgi:hypothetical protein